VWFLAGGLLEEHLDGFLEQVVLAGSGGLRGLRRGLFLEF
jgi:hypothetical protein